MAQISKEGKVVPGYGDSSGDVSSFNKLSEKDLNNQLKVKPTFKLEKNIYLAENLSAKELDLLIKEHANNLNNVLFNRFRPKWKYSKNESLAAQLIEQDEDDRALTICSATAQAYRAAVIDDKIDPTITYDQHIKLICFYNCVEELLNRDMLKAFYGVEDKIIQEEVITLEDGPMKEALKQFIKNGKIISILKDAEDIYADVAKLADKYAIRLSDGKYFVASDEVQLTFRDPSDQPAWAIWFLNAVPMAKLPDRGKLALIPEKDRKKYYPESISDRPIICHASLWQLGDETSGVMLHTSWNHIAISYAIKIDKPIEIVSILFKAVSHPAHLIRNVSYCPQMSVPGNEWF